MAGAPPLVRRVHLEVERVGGGGRAQRVRAGRVDPPGLCWREMRADGRTLSPDEPYIERERVAAEAETARRDQADAAQTHLPMSFVMEDESGMERGTHSRR